MPGDGRRHRAVDTNHGRGELSPSGSGVTDTIASPAPTVPFIRLSTLWVQLTGTWCNLECTHCINASGPKSPWLKPLDTDTVQRAILEAEESGVKEIYFTGGEPFLHRDILPLTKLALGVAPTTILTNGTLIDDAVVDVLTHLANDTPYSLEIRISLDDTDPAKNDRIRGCGTWEKAMRAIRLLDARGLLPIVTATEIASSEYPANLSTYQRFHDFLLSHGIKKPRVKIMPVFTVGRLAPTGNSRLTEETLEGFDRSTLQCAEARVVAHGGVYACPILAGLPGARLSEDGLETSFRSTTLYHSACVTCYQTGMTCRNS